jgi:hypothetical protein
MSSSPDRVHPKRKVLIVVFSCSMSGMMGSMGPLNPYPAQLGQTCLHLQFCTSPKEIPKCLATQLRQKEVLVAHSHDRSIYPRCSAVGTRLACFPQAKTQLPCRNSTLRGLISLVRQRRLSSPSLMVLLPPQYAHDKRATDPTELRLSRTSCVLGTNATLFESSS